MKFRFALIATAVFALFAPASAQDLAGLAPADEYFGRFGLSVLGIANSIRDAGFRLDTGADPRPVIEGPLAFVSDAIHAWETKYPADPWIAKDLFALENAYLKVPSDDGLRLAANVEGWLVADFPGSSYAARGRAQLASATGTSPAANAPWERYASLRAPLPPPR